MSSSQESNLGTLVDNIVDASIIAVSFDGLTQLYNIYRFVYDGLKMSQDQIMNYSLGAFAFTFIGKCLFDKFLNSTKHDQ